jgi:uncharacterized protein (TIGR03032 family)
VSVTHPETEQPSATAKPVEASAGLVPWMLQHRVGLVFSSYQDGYVYCLGAQSDGRAVFTRAHFQGAMGLAAFSHRIYLASQTQIWRLENILKADELANGRFDRLYIPRNAQFTGALDIHELGVEQPSGRIVFVNTRYSCLATPSVTHAFKPIWKPTFITKLAPEDRCHLNGLAMENGQIHYVTACSATDMVDGWREHRARGGVVIDVDEDRIVGDGLSMPHSPRVDDGNVWLLNSGTGHLCRLDLASGKREDVAFCPGFLRGLALVDNYAVVTLSLPRNGRFQGLALEEELSKRRAVPWCGLLVIDVRNGNIAHWVRFHDDIKELFDVAVIPEVRCPRGLPPNVGDAQHEVISFEDGP